MKISKALSNLMLLGLLAYAAGVEAFKPRVQQPAPAPPPNLFGLVLKTVVVTLVIALGLGSIGLIAFIMSGVYDLKAVKPHTPPVEWMLQTLKTNAVRFHSQGIRAPNLKNGSLLQTGFGLFHKNCEPCHGGPGVAAEQIGRGINPKPPRLDTRSSDWNDAELYWIVSEGLKMSGMPAFEPRLSDRDRWGIVAFVRRLNHLSPTEYQKMCAASDQGIQPTRWGDDDRQGFARIRLAHRENGPALLHRYGCISCHTVGGIGRGLVGPPLNRFAERQYIGGMIVNLPTNLMNWIMNPKQYKPATGMPALGVSSPDAADIAAYLYSLGGYERISALQQH